MRIVMLSDHESSGGAAIAAGRLASALAARGHEVQRVVRHAQRGNQAWYTTVLAPDLVGRIAARAARSVAPDLQPIIQRGFAVLGLKRLLARLKPDIISVHNLHGASWPIEFLEVCSHQAPVVATLHDMWSFTGRCAYAYDCLQFRGGCNASCPTPNEYPALAARHIAAAWNRRRETFQRARRERLVAVTPSRWLAAQATSGLWRGFRVEAIPNGLDLDVYRPLGADERAAVRRELGLPHGSILGLVAAASLADRRKGWSYLASAFEQAPALPIVVCAVGSSAQHVRLPGREVLPLGEVSDERLLSRIFAAADLLLHPAPVDNLPNVVMEAMACGTPTVAFAIGGLPELVRPMETGWLASELTAARLGEALAEAATSLRDGSPLAVKCRDIATHEYGAALQAERYERLFREIGD